MGSSTAGVEIVIVVYKCTHYYIHTLICLFLVERRFVVRHCSCGNTVLVVLLLLPYLIMDVIILKYWSIILTLCTT